MKIECFVVGSLGTNCYLLTDEKTGLSAVIDPGAVSEPLLSAVKSAGNIQLILLTHGHFDHIGAAGKLKNLTGASMAILQQDALFLSDNQLNLSAFFSQPLEPLQPDRILHDGDTIQLGELVLSVLHTPGHTQGSCCFAVGDALFTGDTLMCLAAGRTDFPTGSSSNLRQSLLKLRDIKGEYRVFPGHGEETTLAFERENNPYMKEYFYDFDS